MRRSLVDIWKKNSTHYYKYTYTYSPCFRSKVFNWGLLGTAPSPPAFWSLGKQTSALLSPTVCTVQYMYSAMKSLGQKPKMEPYIPSFIRERYLTYFSKLVLKTRLHIWNLDAWRRALLPSYFCISRHMCVYSIILNTLLQDIRM